MLVGMNVIGTAGHVDHGKSTLVERLTGIDPDRFAEEKRRGLTIDLGFAWLRLPSGTEIGLIDVPGHERFIKNMLAGAGGISVCLFVVAANEGWKPQSAEHLSIIDLLGIEHGVVALTKADLVDADALAAVTEGVRAKLAPSSLRGAPIVPCSATTGAGLDTLVGTLDEVVGRAPKAADLGRPRLWVDRVFTIAGAGTVVTGTLGGGVVRADMEVEISPEGRRARVRGIQSHKKKVESIGPGNRVALNLAGLEREGAERGDAIVEPKRWRPTTLIDVELRVLPADVSGHAHELTAKGSHLLYLGAAETPVRVKLLDDDELRAGDRGFAQLTLRDPLPGARGDRFVLRDAGRKLTFGGGEVLDPLPLRARRGDQDRLLLLERLRGASPDEAAAALVEAEGAVRADELAARVSAVVSAVPGAVGLGNTFLSRARYAEVVAKLHAVLSAHHAARPLEKGMLREAVRAELELDPASFDALVDSDDEVAGEGPALKLATHGVVLDPEQQRARDELVVRIESGGFAPPLEKELGSDPSLVRALVEAGELVRIDGFFLTAEQARDARGRVRSTIESNGPMTVAEIRDLLGTTRKYAVPLCEWLDRTGATRRNGDERTLGPTP
jgi:selenocysteine-specific elongation factor